jgi:hypothetical protein
MKNSEEIEAASRGMTVRVYRLQNRLRSLPPAPRNEALRKRRNQVSEELIRVARVDKCISKINLMAGTVD